MLLNPVNMLFDYYNSYATVAPEAYETLLLDIVMGDATLFMRADQVEAAWSILMPIIEAWEANTTTDFPNYLLVRRVLRMQKHSLQGMVTIGL